MKQFLPVDSVRGFIEKDNKILLLRRDDTSFAPGRWSLPGGTYDHDMGPRRSLTEMVKTKTNLSINSLNYIGSFNSPPFENQVSPNLVFYFVAQGQGEVQLDASSSDYRWLSLEDVMSYNPVLVDEQLLDTVRHERKPEAERLRAIMDAAGEANVPITSKDVDDLQLTPEFFAKFKRDMVIYELAKNNVETMMKNLHRQLKRNGEYIISNYKLRMKPERSLFEKMVRKGEPGVPRPYTTFDDIIGARATVQYLDDIYRLVETIEQEYPLFEIKEKDDFVYRARESGYRGMHLTLVIPMYGIKDVNFTPRCEIQLRTISQDAWASVTRAEAYKCGVIPPAILEQYLTLSDHLHEGDILMQQISAAMDVHRNGG